MYERQAQGALITKPQFATKKQNSPTPINSQRRCKPYPEFAEPVFHLAAKVENMAGTASKEKQRIHCLKTV